MNILNGMAILTIMNIYSRNIFNKIIKFFMQDVVNHYYLKNYMIMKYVKI